MIASSSVGRSNCHLSESRPAIACRHVWRQVMLRKQAAEARKCAVLRIESTFIAARGLLSQGRSGLHLKVDVSTSQLNLWTKHSSIGKFWSPVSFGGDADTGWVQQAGWCRPGGDKIIPGHGLRLESIQLEPDLEISRTVIIWFSYISRYIAGYPSSKEEHEIHSRMIFCRNSW